MRRPSGWQLGILCLLLLVLAVPAWVGAQSTPQELERQLASSDLTVQLAALEEIAELGAAAAGLVPAVEKLLASDDLAVRHEAVVALGAIGPAASAAVPRIEALLTSPELLLRYQAVVSLRSIGGDSQKIIAVVEPLLADDDRLVRVEAAATLLANATPRQSAAIKVLVDALQDGRGGVRAAALPWLTMSGTAAVEPLLEVLKAGPVAAQAAAAEALGDMGPLAKSAVPLLVDRLASNSAVVVAAAARALGQIGETSKEILTAFRGLCAHESVPVRVAVLQGLSRLGQSAEVIQVLEDALDDDDVVVRITACDALGSLGGKAQPCIPALLKALGDPAGAVTMHASEALGQIGGSAVPELQKLLSDDRLAAVALHTLEMLGPVARPATQSLVARLQQPGVLTQRNLCLAIAAIGADPKLAGPALQQVLNDPNSEARAAAAYALGRIGDRSAIKNLTNVVEDENPLLRLAAAWSLLELDPNEPDYIKIAVPRLIEALSRPEPQIRLQAVRTLARLKGSSRPALPELIRVVGADEDRDVRIAAAMAIAELGDHVGEVVPRLVELVSSRDLMGRRAAIFTLGRLGASASEAVPTLKQVLRTGSPEDRVVAAWSLLRIGGDAESQAIAVPVIMNAIPGAPPEIAVPLLLVAGQYAAGHPELLKTVQSMLSADDPALRAAAASALDQAQSSK